MTTYKEILGKQVKNYSSDPANDAEGQVWYNTTSGTFKSLLATAAWSSGGNLITARYGQAGAGTQTAGLAFGGVSTGTHANTEEYNGSGFSVGGNLSTARYLLGGAGTQTAALGFGGEPPPAGLNSTEEYGGASWTSGGNLNQARRAVGGNGLQTAALAVGGVSSPGILANTESYNGTVWTAVNNLNQARRSPTITGTTSAALAFGGYNPPAGDVTANTESWDGTNWTAVNSMNTGVFGAGGAGTAGDSLAFGGNAPSISPGPTETTATENYDGTNWTTSPATLTSKRSYLAGFGTSTAAVAAGGYTGTAVTSATEEYNFSTTVTTAAAWASGGNMNTARRIGGGSSGGNINSSLMFGGDTLPMGAGQPQTNVTEEYNGSAWTNGGNLGNNVSGSAGAGTETAMIGATGYSFPSPWGTAGASYIANAFEYNGSAWTNVTAYPTTGVGLISLGTQTAALFGGGAQGGSPGPEGSQKSKLYKEYDGTNWTTGGTSNTYHSRAQSGAGTQTAGIQYGGYDAPGGNPSGRSNKLESYNGTAWTSELTGPIETAIGQAFGTQSAYVYSGGQNAPIPASPGTVGYSFTTLVYDGTTMSTGVNTATRRVIGGGDGSSGASTGMVCGGSSAYSTVSNSTEEYSVETTAINTKTLTTS
jgi:hypothetical protein